MIKRNTMYWIKEVLGTLYLVVIAYIWLVVAFIMSQ